MKVKTKYIILAILIGIFGVYVLGRYSGRKKAESVLNPLILSQEDRIISYVLEIGDKTTYIAQKETEILSQREAIKRSDIERKELSALNLKQVNEISRLKLRVDTLLEDVNNSGGVITIHDTITLKPTNYVKLPFIVTKNDQWLSLKDSTDINGKTSILLKMNLSLDVWTGRSQKTKKYTTLITTDSPYIGVIGIKSQKYDVPKQRPYGIGLQIGYGLTTQLKPTPYIGIGLQYSLIKF